MAPRSSRGAISFLVARSGRGLFVPDAFVQRFGLVLEQRPEDLGRALSALEHLAAGQVERGILRVVAGDGAQAMLAQAVDQPANSRPVDRAGAHCTGFGG